MRSPLLFAALPLFVLLTVAAPTSAEAIVSPFDYNTAYMVKAHTYQLALDSNNEYSYAPGERPWVYIKLRLEDLNVGAPLHVLWSWSSASDPYNNETKLKHLSLVNLNSDKEIWSPAPQPWWAQNGGPGQWTVDIAWLNSGGAQGTSSATFNVTPEPVSSALFLLGGVPVAAALLRKKRKGIVSA